MSGTDTGALFGLRRLLELQNSGPPLQAGLAEADAALTPGQERIWEASFSGHSGHNRALCYRLRGALELPALELALVRLRERHPILDARFFEKRGSPRMRLSAFARRPLVVETMPAVVDEGELTEMLNAIPEIPFDLRSEAPFRPRLWRVEAKLHILCLEFHHIAFDYWSLDTIHRDLARLYAACRNGEADQLSQLPTLPLNFADFAAWQRSWLATPGLLEDLLGYWNSVIGERDLVSPPLPEAQAHARHTGRRLQIQWPESFARDLKRFAGARRTTLNSVALAAFFVVLYHFGHSRRDKFFVCSPVACRNRPGLENLVGYFNNLVLLGADLSGNPTCVELIERARIAADGAFAHQDLPFQYAARLSRGPQQPARVLFSLLNTPRANLELEDIFVEAAGPVGAGVDFDLFLYLEDQKHRLRTVWEYSEDLFSKETILAMAEHYRVVVARILRHPDDRLEDLPRPTEAQIFAFLGKRSGSKIGADDPPNSSAAGPPEERRPGAVAALAESLRAELRDEWSERSVGAVDPGQLRNGIRDFLSPFISGDPDWNRSLVALGVDSLLALRLRRHLRESYGIDIQPGAVLTGARLDELARGARNADSEFAPPHAFADPGLSSGDTAGLSHGQSALWFLYQADPEDTAYNVASLLRVPEALDEERLNLALQCLAARYPILSSTFPARSGRPTGPIYSAPAPICKRVELTTIDDAHAGAGRHSRDDAGDANPHSQHDVAAAIQQLQVEHRRPFDLEAGPLWRAVMLPDSEGATYLLLGFHHLIVDHRSIQLLVRELREIYARGIAARQRPLYDYSDFVAGQRAMLAGPRGAQLADFWREVTGRDGGLPDVSLPLERERGAGGAEQLEAFFLDEASLHSLQEFGSDLDATLSTVLLAAFLGILHRLSGERDLVIGMLTDIRPETGFDDVPGYFSNAVLIRSIVEGDPSLREFVASVRDTAAKAQAHRDYPYSLLVEQFDLPRAVDRTPGFQVLYNFLDARRKDPALDFAGDSGEAWTEVQIVQQESQFDLILEAVRTADGLRLAFKFRRDRYSRRSVRGLRETYAFFLDSLRSRGERDSLFTAELLTPAQLEERARWNDTEREFPRDARIDAAILDQVERTPDRIALVFEDRRLSYLELQERILELARRLRSRGAGPGVRVGIYLRRSLEMAIALPAVLAAGAAYIPLDPDYPAERLAFITQDADLQLIISDEGETPPGFAPGDPRLISPQPDEAESLSAIGDGATGGRQARPEDPAYILYTSGSTGRPRGVVVSHRNVVNFFAGMDDRIEPGTDHPGVWLAVTSISFDISVLELLWTLSRGFTVVIQADDAPPTRSVRELDFSVFYFAGDDSAGSDAYRLLLEGAKFADDRGFAGVWLPERHFHRFGGLFPNPSVTAAALAVLTKRIRIRAGSVVLPLHEPVRVAEEWSVVDNLSGGRVELSFATGWHPADFALAPDRFAKRRSVLESHLDQVRRLWRGESLTMRSGDGEAVRIELHPRPVQAELPVFLTAATNPETFRLAGRSGAGVLTHLLGQDLKGLADRIQQYRAARREAGHVGTGRVVLMLHAFVAADREFALNTARGPLRDYIRSSSSLARSAMKTFTDLPAQELSSEDADRMLEQTLDRYMSEMGLFGSPESCLELVRKLKELEVDEIACLIDFGVETDLVLENMIHLDALRNSWKRMDQEARSTQELIEAWDISHMQCTPSFARMLLADENSAAALKSIQTLLVGGEAFPDDLARELSADRFAGRVLNMYGPTETTIWSCVFEVQDPERITIGTPIANTQIYIRNEAGANVLAGVPGEIWIGGEGVAAGYWNQPESTAARFVEEGGRRLYRTGDRGRFLEEAGGEIEFLGRLDHQVKLRGHRIEPGEIETHLKAMPGVREALVSLRGDPPANQALVAYLVLNEDGRENGANAKRATLAEECGRFLRDRLPGHMIPSFFLALDEWPLTPNGKIDRRALPDPGGAANREPTGAPGNPVEKLLAETWSAVLNRESVGVHENFFMLGGNSLLAFQTVARLRREVWPEFQLRDFMAHQTVAEQARLLAAAGVGQERPQASPNTEAKSAGREGGDLIVPLQEPAGARVNLFLAPPTAGNSLCYLPLAAELGDGIASFGLQTPGAPGDGRWPRYSAREIAREFVSAMRGVQAAGPYAIGGWSFGGQVAFEMSRLLREEGEAIQALFLIDCPLQGVALSGDWSNLWRVLYPGESDLRRAAGLPGISANALQTGAAAFDLAALLRTFTQFGGELLQVLPVFAANVVAEMAYRPVAADIDAVYFASGGVDRVPAAWRELIRGQLDVRALAGGHFSVFEADNLQILSRAIRAAVV